MAKKNISSAIFKFGPVHATCRAQNAGLEYAGKGAGSAMLAGSSSASSPETSVGRACGIKQSCDSSVFSDMTYCSASFPSSANSTALFTACCMLRYDALSLARRLSTYHDAAGIDANKVDLVEIASLIRNACNVLQHLMLTLRCCWFDARKRSACSAHQQSSLQGSDNIHQCFFQRESA